MDGNGGGLIAAPSDQSPGTWGCGGYFIGGTATEIGTGNQNTINIDAGCITIGIASDICANLSLASYTDWFLPSRDELILMYQNIGPGNALGLGNVGGFNVCSTSDNCYYWSSTEYNDNSAYARRFLDGVETNGGKGINYRVRAVRAF